MVMQASNSLLRPRPACFTARPQVRTLSGECLVRTGGRLRFLVPSGLESPQRNSRRHPARPLLPEKNSCIRVVEGRVRSLLVAAIVIAAGLACARGNVSGLEGISCTVHLRPEVTMKGSQLVLADIADLSGDNEEFVARLARTPLGPITQTRLLSRKDIAELIRTAGADEGEVLYSGAEFTRISPAMRTPTLAEITPVVKSYLASVTPWQGEELEVRSIENLKDIEVPAGDIQFRIASRGAPSNFRSALLAVETLVDGRLQRPFWIKADIAVRATVVQVAKPVAFRSVLRPEDLREVTANLEDPSADYIRSAADVAGKVTKRALRQGEYLTRKSLDDAELIRSGASVRLVVETGNLRMSAMARALQSGKLGDRIKVRNMDSDRVITAVVTGRGEVRVTN